MIMIITTIACKIIKTATLIMTLETTHTSLQTG